MIKQSFEQGFIKRAKEVAQEHGLTHEELFKLLGAAHTNEQFKREGGHVMFGPHIKDINEREYKMRKEMNQGGGGVLGALLGAVGGGVVGHETTPIDPTQWGAEEQSAREFSHAVKGSGIGMGLGALLGAGAGHLATSRKLPKDTKYMT